MPHYIHRTDVSPLRHAELWQQGQNQAIISIQRYHYLCAAIQKKYEIIQVHADMERFGIPFDRQGVTFEAYGASKLEPILAIKIHPRSDGTVHPEDIGLYARGYEDHWKCMEGGILYWVAEYREFWNMIVNYHSSAGTMGRTEWDDLFSRLKASNFPKNIIPCMVSIYRYQMCRCYSFYYLSSFLLGCQDVLIPDARFYTTKKRP